MSALKNRSALVLMAFLNAGHLWAADDKSEAVFKDALTKRLAFIFKDEKLDRTH